MAKETKVDYSFADNVTKLKQSIDAVKARKEEATTENVKAEYILRAGKLAKGHEVEEEDEEKVVDIDVENAKIKDLKKFAKANNIDIKGVDDVEEIRALIKANLK